MACTPTEQTIRCMAKIRYRQADQLCRVTLSALGTAEVVFDQPQRAVTPGQFVVFYRDDECLGSGVIECTQKARAIAMEASA